MGKSMKETKEYHTRYLRAINNPTRRKILRSLKGGCKTIMDLKSDTGLDTTILNWHLDILENGFCVEKDIRSGDITYKRTQEGEVVSFLDG
jgi:DNA-binding transcriptional ArsR family regulator